MKNGTFKFNNLHFRRAHLRTLIRLFIVGGFILAFFHSLALCEFLSYQFLGQDPSCFSIPSLNFLRTFFVNELFVLKSFKMCLKFRFLKNLVLKQENLKNF